MIPVKPIGVVKVSSYSNEKPLQKQSQRGVCLKYICMIFLFSSKNFTLTDCDEQG